MVEAGGLVLWRREKASFDSFTIAIADKPAHMSQALHLDQERRPDPGRCPPLLSVHTAESRDLSADFGLRT
jgi:hypothetical protein